VHLYFYIYSILGDQEVGTDGWNSMENIYAFLYSKEEKETKNRVLVKCLVTGESLAIVLQDLEAQDKDPYNILIKYEWIQQLHFFRNILLFLTFSCF
jgi:hypothetical protein